MGHLIGASLKDTFVLSMKFFTPHLQKAKAITHKFVSSPPPLEAEHITFPYHTNKCDINYFSNMSLEDIKVDFWLLHITALAKKLF